jgi:hypothetical protein
VFIVARVFSYVITHDTGFAPNPFGDFLTLATCKPKIRASAKKGDWLLGTGSACNVGNNRVIYAAKVDEVLPLEDYGSNPDFACKIPVVSQEPWQRHGDNIYSKGTDGWHQRRNIHHSRRHMERDLRGKNVLICRTFMYFGSGAPLLPDGLLGLVKTGPSHKCETRQQVIAEFESWLERFHLGLLGAPFGNPIHSRAQRERRGAWTMTLPVLNAGHIDEPGEAQGYADVLSRVASDRQPLIVRRGGTDLAAVVPLEYLDLLQEMLARQEAERLAGQLDWDKLVKTSPPPQTWFDGDEPKPF